MLCNLTVIKAAKAFVKNTLLSDLRRAYIGRLMRDYAEACDLSVQNSNDDRPQVAARREHWHNVAGEKRALLCLAINYEEPRTRPCRGEECA